MASLCTVIPATLFPQPMAVPAKNPNVHGTILRARRLLIPTKTFSRALNATQPQKYIYPEPISEFAAAETLKFRAELLKKLSKEKETFGNDLQTVVNVCSEIFNEFLHQEYGGPGTLLIEPFTDMMIVLEEKKLPGAPLAARTSLLWAQNYIDQDWDSWISK
ncbi:protein PLASTID REDOX INSENSITIVE 2, chloroplastic-like isoform X1 [Olea europaea var. sylvestris]|uniref:protein PLASTID REDOX INSENSITIVE 2, chloroplastic-like isoform X1 n=1 Tax=Olea europaea var. sylvestris TaxID=158386 RepID=UPI000C1D8AAF|nr:protein PLASTID REDOX INSENSITIVE 2, chloroplastic-like isoform X1 [Olea europaea var. sylvestris]